MSNFIGTTNPNAELNAKLLTEYNKFLKEFWGYDSLKPEQFTIIKTLLEDGRDVSAILATGFGKSICYQLPVLISQKCVIVVSPLIALMHDQFVEMTEKQIPVCVFNSSVKGNQQKVELMAGTAYKLIYMTPEFLVKNETFIKSLQAMDNLAFIAIDEAHAVSTWGHDFRASYVMLSCIRDWVTSPILTLTATASTKVKNDITNMLRLDPNRLEITGDFNRPNLFIQVHHRDENVLTEIYNILLKYIESPAIIYCLTQKETMEVSEGISSFGIPSMPYHAGLTDVYRKEAQDAFISGKCKCIVATVAFGMGINVRNIRVVIHYDCPKNIENYYQEIGRAGRDGKFSECHLFYSTKDFKTARYFNNQIADGTHRDYQDEQVRLIERFVYTQECRRKLLLASFGQTVNSCPSCDNCMKMNVSVVEKLDYTSAVYLVLSTIARVNEKFGCTMIINIVTGKEKKVKDYMVNYNEYNKGTQYGNEKWWGLFMKKLKEADYITEKSVQSFFGTVTCLTKSGKDTLNGLRAFGANFDAFAVARIPDDRKIFLEKTEIEVKTRGRKPKETA